MLKSHKRRDMEEDLAWFKQQYPTQRGWREGYGSYELLSLDQGQTWYALERCGKEIRVLGSAEEIFPGVLVQRAATRRLCAYAEEHGPIGAGDAQGLEMLIKAGFSVSKG